MGLIKKIRAKCNFAMLKKFYDMLKNGIFCEMVFLVIFYNNLIC